MRFSLKAFAAAAALCLAATSAHAQLAVDKLWIDLNTANAQRADILVRNESKDRYFITIKTARIDNPGNSDEVRTYETDPDKLGLLTTPNRMVLEPGAQRSVRMVAIGDAGGVDRVYRVLISPAVGELTTTGAASDARGLGIKVLTAYEALVVVRPNKGSAKLEVERVGSELRLHNVGNTSTLLYDLSVCAPPPVNDARSGKDGTPLPSVAKAEDKATAEPAKAEPASLGAGKADAPKGLKPACDTIGAKRLYAGNTFSVKLSSPTEPVTARQKTFVSDDALPVKF